MNFTQMMLATVAAVALSVSASADIVFDFRDGSALDGVGVAATFQGSDIANFDGSTDDGSAPLSTLELTVVDIIGQDGLSTGSGPDTGHTLNISGAQQALGINTDNTADDNFISGNADSQNFNAGEIFVFSFNQDINLTNVEVESFTAGETVLTLSSNATTVNLGDSFNSLAGFFVAAGDSVSLEFVSTSGDATVRVESFQAVIVPPSTIPEPSSLALIGLLGIGMASRRRR